MTLYEQIEAIAQPIVKHYWGDVVEHDKRALSQFRRGDSALWACRSMGSHLARLTFSDMMTLAERHKATLDNWRVLQATNDIWDVGDWYLLTATDDNGNGTIVKMSEREAEQMFADAISAVRCFT